MKAYFLIGQHFCEMPFLTKVVSHLNTFPELDRYTLFITNKLDELPRYGNDVAVIVVSDEEYRIPKYLNKVRLTFHNYVRDESYKSLIPLPLGYVAGFPELPMTPINERELDVFFIGQKWGVDRIHMFNEVEKIRKNFPKLKFEVRLTEQFKAGLSIQEYGKYLMNSKIALCPMGVKAAETFRFFEATKSGCAIISCLQSDNYIYRNSPSIKIDEWGKITSVLETMTTDKIQDLHLQTLKFWNDYCSEKAVAELVRRKVIDA